MKAETRALGEVLLKHHVTVRRPPGTKLHDHEVQSAVLAYGTLCERAGVPWLTRSVGVFLGELASWCSANKFPPLNSLAVNAETRLPGDGYYNAEQCKKWPIEVRECLTFVGYPTKMP